MTGVPIKAGDPNVDLGKSASELNRLVKEAGGSILKKKAWSILGKMGLDPGANTRERGTVIRLAKVRVADPNATVKHYVLKAQPKKRPSDINVAHETAPNTEAGEFETVTYKFKDGMVMAREKDGSFKITRKSAVTVQITYRI